MDIITYVLAKRAGAAAAAAQADVDALEQVVESIKNGIQYKGAVNYYNELPSGYGEEEVGYCYTVKYKGSSGTQPSGKEYIWGSYEGELQWIELGGFLDNYIKSIEYGDAERKITITDQDNNSFDIYAAKPTDVEAVATDLEAETQRAEDAEDALDDKIEAETTRATDKEGELETAIGNEATARANADTALGGRIDDAETAIGAVAADLAQEVLDRQDAIATEVTDRNNAILVAINGEIQARDSAINNAIASEVTARNTAIEEAVAGEASRAQTAEGGLSDRITAIENDYLTSADKTELQGAIDNEATARAEAIAQEVIDRDAAIAVETENREAADTALGGRIDDAETAIGNEETRATTAEGALSGRLDTIEGEIQEGTTAANPLTNKEYVDTLVVESGHTHANKAILDEITQEDLDQIGLNEQAITAIKDGVSIDSFGDVETALADKQDTISDLEAIRAGAALGDTSIQPGDNISELANDANYATETYVDQAIEALPEPMIFKGSVGENGTIEWDALPGASAENEGFTYKVITKHTTAPICEVGDTIISNAEEWVVIPSGDEPSGTVTSVDVSVPTGLTSTGGPITSSGTIAIGLDTGYTIPTEVRLSDIETNIANIKDGEELESFGDVETALVDYYKKTETYSKAEIDTTLGGYYTKTEIDDTLDGYYTKADTYNKTEVDTALSGKQDTIDTNHKLAAELVDDTNATNKFITPEQAQDILDNKAAKHEHANKALLDTYDQTNADITDAVSKKHDHSNKALLDTYTQTEANLADAVAKTHEHANKATLDNITAAYTTEEATKLAGIEAGAQVNVLEGVKVNDVDLEIVDKKVNITIDLSDYATKAEVQAEAQVREDADIALDNAKQDNITEENKLDIDLVDAEYATDVDITEMFPEEASSAADVKAILSGNEPAYIELEGTASDTAGFSIVGKDIGINLNGQTLAATQDSALKAANGARLVIDGEGTVNAQEFGVLAVSNSEVEINGGTFTTTDNVVIGTNGTKDKGKNTIVINDGVFNGNITTPNYIACGIYAANDDTIIVNGGEFNITNGCGVCARSGDVVIGPGAVFTVTGSGSGWVGDSKVQVPAGVKFVLDLQAAYPGGDPTITINGIKLDKNSTNEEAADVEAVILRA